VIHLAEPIKRGADHGFVESALVSRFGTLLGTGLLIAAMTLLLGCSGNGVGIGILTGSNPSPEKPSPPGVFLPDLTGRPEQVAFTSACALAYGFTHDPVKLRAAYLAFESKRGAAREQLSNIEKAYDTTYQAIEVMGARKTSYCATKDGEEVRSELRRYTSGFFEPRSPVAEAPSASWKKTRVDPDCGGRC
jgi:hypothetical protein